MATSVSLTINFRDGTSQTISQSTVENSGIVRYDKLVKSLSYVQEQSNSILTTLVNQEKAQKCDSGSVVEDGVGSNEEQTNSSSGNEDDETEDDEDDDIDKPSEEKRRKI